MKIILTGGGTAGHVVPNLALVPGLLAAGFEIEYIGGKGGMEQALVEDAGIVFHAISVGKLRRYFSLKNFSDGFKVIKGVAEARKLLKKIKPNVVFSKGGFVPVPVVFAAKMAKIPVVIHESDITVGLANRLAIPHAQKICYVFPESLAALPKNKAVWTGTPLRAEILGGSALAGAKICGFEAEKPVIMVIGGSSGSASINSLLRQALPNLITNFNIIHVCGKGNLDESLENSSYRQFEYITKGIGDLFAYSKVVVSRAGSNSLAEILALNKPNILIPLPKSVSRGDQILNAQSFEKQGFSVVLTEENLSPDMLVEAINSTFENRGIFRAAMAKSPAATDASRLIIDIIKEVSAESD
ncbi:MAG: undecaprenyldiphospho-muramoylpentapeptide beta-N-acetylglucosaminyltransferase [Clostridiales bacterium]|jgi:UDP-N-acetylglucosamine--N-acetylmuramyl-(pentapeptide) pyrophosphoryl-undecaprenol N-acetylglucosamine transferase|nr:undecaprenyldiphospho-muramoylpentapeptide beta-N-acetylglucosaminyltransferase [Clostridiales bacterium]